MKRFGLILLSFICITASADAEEVQRPFETDDCTGYSEGPRRDRTLWAECCKTHDLYFWAGGDRAQRREADRNLRNCVREKGAPVHAQLMYWGVKIGGLSPIKIKGKQWGNAWGNHTRRATLTSDEILKLQDNLEKISDLSPETIQAFIADLRSKNE